MPREISHYAGQPSGQPMDNDFVPQSSNACTSRHLLEEAARYWSGEYRNALNGDKGSQALLQDTATRWAHLPTTEPMRREVQCILGQLNVQDKDAAAFLRQAMQLRARVPLDTVHRK